MEVTQDCIDLIKKFEGCNLSPYLDCVDIPTIGYGTTIYLNNNIVTMEDEDITEKEAEDLLKEHLDLLTHHLSGLISVDLAQCQIDALLSLVYNIGLGHFIKSTLLHKLNENDMEGAAEQFLVWRMAGGKINKGLENRRAAEKELFQTA